MKTEFCGVTFKNPVTVCSGTFASGKEYSEFVDLSKLGAVTTKGVSKNAWMGNDAPRICETHGGMLNSIGLQNAGVSAFIKNDLPFLSQFDTKIIVNVSGKTIDEYVYVAETLSETNADFLEVNISCPNVAEGGLLFGVDPKSAEEVTRAVKKVSKKPVIVKLSPNVTDIAEIALAAQSGGADAVSLINTLLGMRIDIYKKKPMLKNVYGGLSGPAVKPVALRMVNQVYKSVKIPIVGMGGIATFEDAIEFIMAGATLVSVGTANFGDPNTTLTIIDGMRNYMEEMRLESFSEIRGVV